MKFKTTYKKYSYLTKKELSTRKWLLKKRLDRYSFKGPLKDYAPLDTEKLPFPTSWSDEYDYDNLIIELGTGHGELMKFNSEKHENSLLIGFEITKKYSKKSWNKVSDKDNALQFKGDGYLLINNLFENSSISQVYILFPDPWHKKKHNKRRPITSEWLIKLYEKLDDGGEIFFATDWMDYYDHVVEQFDALPSYFSYDVGVYDPLELDLVETHYYEKWKEMGRSFKYLSAIKIAR